ncbi:replication initiation protein [Bacillus sp. FJAT-29937]|uniref:replication initiation protein n=1 Tax=Bacillus sp. FJAT-29937 TaxID=1720553 RepID=UPI00082AB7EF|nr:replication initiation protein [Bacillus sp. FJAT-29937]
MMEKLNADIYEIDTKDWITKSNSIIESQYKLTLQEQRILLITASKVQPSDEDFKPYKFRVTDLIEKMGVGSQTSMYSYIKNVVKGLQSKTVEFKKGNRTMIANWLVTSIYEDQEGTVILKFNPDLKDFFLQLKERFTTYQLENVIQLNSVYSIRIYELLKQYENLKKRSFTIDELRDKLGIEKTKYKQYGHFKDRVINAAQQELAEKTDISFTFEEEKKGRKVVGIIFRINGKKGTIPKQQHIATIIEKSEEKELKDRLKDLEVNERLFDYIFNAFSYEQIRRNIVYSEERKGSVTSIGGFTYKAITSDYALTKEESITVENSVKIDKQEDILFHLIKYWRKTKEPLTYWLVDEISVEEIQRFCNMTTEEALSAYDQIKNELCLVIKVKRPSASHQ